MINRTQVISIPNKFKPTLACVMKDLFNDWNDFDIVKKEKLQNLVFPEGIFYSQEIKGYRTPKQNSFLHLINTEIGSYRNEKSDKIEINQLCRFLCE